MQKIISIVLSVFIIGSAQAATKASSNAKYANDMTASSVSSKSGFKFEGRPGAGVTAGYFTFGANLESKYGFKISGNTLFVGIETGFFRTSLYSSDVQTISATSFPITPSATFEMPINKNIKLYAGTSIGVSIATVSNSISANQFGFGEDRSASSTSGLFVWKFRPGMVIADQFVAELPIGTIDGNFYFVPNVGVRF